MLDLTKALKAKCESLRLRYVPGSGNPSSKLWIIGEAPGEEEDAALQPFVGKAGYKLNELLRTVGIRRENCYVGNISPVRPPNNNLKRIEEIGIEFGEAASAMVEQVGYFKPNCVLALGAASQLALTGKVGIKEWRGYYLNCNGVKVISSFHPAFLLHMGEKSAKKERENKGGVKYTYGTARMAILLDMKRAREEAEFAGMVIPKRNLIWDCDQADLVHYLENFMREEEVAFDIETLGNWPDRIAFASKHIAVSFLINRAKEQVAEILAKHEGLIAQNGMFDVKILKKNGLPVGRLYADTMICHNLLYPEWPHGLDFLASIYTKLAEPPHCPGWDSVGNRGRKNAEHAAITLEVWKKLEQELKEVENVQQKA